MKSSDLPQSLLAAHCTCLPCPMSANPCATLSSAAPFFPSAASHSQPDLQMRFVPGCSLDADGVKAYTVFGELKKQVGTAVC